MPHISKRRLDYRIEKELNAALEYVLTHSNSAEIKTILEALTTRTERLMIAKRLGVALMLKDGYPNSTIDEVLKVTRATVGKLELIISDHFQGYELALKKENQRQIKQGLKEVLQSIAKTLVSSSFGRTPGPKL